MYVFAACLKQQVKTLCCVALPLPDTHPFRLLPRTSQRGCTLKPLGRSVIGHMKF
ncbi:hypothetical protein SEA_OCTOBIEN14_45 [Gordonia phage Octobien14]|uniref:Uncharacterized protein n=1 Tax=Gordonia phage Octobien14 TaxID=2483673 RepID=A0A3G3M9U0_9CAUD|nr:hypothetical protein L3Y22_gp045 [Gordonia phage Octobien14]AYR03280.1 hypothetical protein SEA_OCTOBIEN14_45 [Gordonia phage Octobien14]